MDFFKITFANGNLIKTGFNGTLDEAKIYYLNNCFELIEGQDLVKVISVELLS